MLRLLTLVSLLILGFCLIYWFKDWWPWAIDLFDDQTSNAIQGWEAAIQIALSVLELIIVVIFGRSFYQIIKAKEAHTPTVIPHAATQNPTEFLKQYYQELHHTCSRLNLSLIDPRFGEFYRKAEITLPGIYQDMEVIPWREDRDDSSSRHTIEAPKEQRQALIEAAAEDKYKRLVIKGDVGSGKSMFVDYLAAQIAATHLHDSDYDLPAAFRHRPVMRLRLRSIIKQLKNQPEPEKFLLDVIRAEIETICAIPVDDTSWNSFQQQLLLKGIILLDGLDEVPKTEGLRATLFDAIDALKKRLGNDARLIITSRPYVFDDEHYNLAGFDFLELVPMSNNQIQQFVESWYLLMRNNRNLDEAQAKSKAGYLFKQLKEVDYLLQPARRPLLLTLLTSLHFARNVLPHSRAELYHQTIDLMLERWTQRAYDENPDYPLEDFERKALAESVATRQGALQQVALSANRAETLEIPATDIKALFSDYLSDDCNANSLLDFMRFRSGILKPGKDECFEFYHRSFQDYLAALALTDQQDWQDEIETLLTTEKGLEWWGEVFLLLVSSKIYGNSKPEAVDLLRRFIPQTIDDYSSFGDQRWNLLLLAAKAIIEQQQELKSYYQNNRHYKAVYDDLQQHLLRLVESEHGIDIAIRARAGRRLGALGDPRNGVTILCDANDQPVKTTTNSKNHSVPDITWVKIPTGEFQMGSADDDEDAFDDEKPTHNVAVDEFNISKFPITNAQFQCFIDADGYDNDRYWKYSEAALAWRNGKQADLSLLKDLDDKLRINWESWLLQDTQRASPRFWEQRQWNIPNHPVVGISWYEALAYCKWLNECLRQPKLPDQPVIKGIIRLPSEEEWEYAARGTQGLIYAWGNKSDKDKGNYQETQLERTTSVGLFPPGIAFDGSTNIYDLSCNVWEWTQSRWGKSINQPDFEYRHWGQQDKDRNDPEPVELRVIRGGSWDDDRRDARCASRYRIHPINRINDVGFRVVFSLAADD
ncbi:MAG: SUMF1/EgtB/PvdO family nonheme iron enzyme [Methylococcaceae bacterium]